LLCKKFLPEILGPLGPRAPRIAGSAGSLFTPLATAKKLGGTVQKWRGMVVCSRHEQQRLEKLGRRQPTTETYSWR